MNPLLSILVPVYNVEPYITQCIESILNQTFSDFEVILVDDGSKDNSGCICDSFAEKDSRIHVIHKPNGGLVSARKTGLQAAKGKYIGTVDSDDWVDPDMFRIMVETAEADQAELVHCDHWEDALHIVDVSHSNFPAGSYEGAQLEEIKKQLLNYQNTGTFGIAPSIWSKLFLREKLLPFQLQVDESIKMGEDVAVTVPYISACTKIHILRQPLYHYRMNETSITHSYNPNLLPETLTLQTHLYDSLDRQYWEQLKFYWWRLSKLVLAMEMKSYTSHRELRQHLKYLTSMPVFSRCISSLDGSHLNDTWFYRQLFSAFSGRQYSKCVYLMSGQRWYGRIKRFLHR